MKKFLFLIAFISFSVILFGQSDSKEKVPCDIQISEETIIKPTCSYSTNGSITVSYTDEGSLSYYWSTAGGCIPPGQQTNQNLTNICPGEYYVSVNDGSCSTVFYFTVETKSIYPEYDLIVTDPCAGDCNGEVVFEIYSENFAPYSIEWLGDNELTHIEGYKYGNVCSQYYDFAILDNLGCSYAGYFYPSQVYVEYEISSDNTYCEQNEGYVEVWVAGQEEKFEGDYSFEWNKNGNTPMGEDGSFIENLGVGVYFVTITDNNTGCTATDYAVVGTYNDFIEAYITGDDYVSCFGSTDGELTAAYSYGSGDMNYLWNTGSTNQTIESLEPGVYSVTITDNNPISGCPLSFAYFEIDEPEELRLVNKWIKSPSCIDEGDGEIDLYIWGGTYPLNFNWSHNSELNYEYVTNLEPAIYSVTITDANDCELIISDLEVKEPFIDVEITSNKGCFGYNDASITVVVTGSSYDDDGEGGHQQPSKLTMVTLYQFSLDGQDWSAPAPDWTFNNLENEETISYTIYVKPFDYECEYEFAYELIAPLEIDLNATITEITCNGANDGKIVLNPINGTAPYTCLWQCDSEELTATDLGAGDYTVIVTDSKGCSVVETFTIDEEPEALSSTITNTSATCFVGCNGTARVNPLGGTSPYTYKWSNNSTLDFPKNLCQGKSYVTITDDRGCTHVDSVTIGKYDEIVISITSQQNVLCNGSASGDIHFATTGGSGSGFIYAVENLVTNTTGIFSGLIAGAYILIVEDDFECKSASYNFEITEPEVLTFSASVSQPNCFNSNDASIVLTVEGGVTPYSYEWNDALATDSILNPELDGMYYVTVSDANNCVVLDSFTIVSPDTIIVDYELSNITCFGLNNGSISLTVTGGTPNYTYDWSSGQTTSAITNLEADTFIVIVKDDKLCSVTDTFIITSPTELIVNSVINEVSCFGLANGSIQLSLTGGTPEYAITWSTDDTTSVINNLVAGIYEVTVSDQNNCQIVDTFMISSPSEIIIDYLKTDVSCFNSANASIELNVSGGTPNYTYLWSNGNTTSVITGLSEGNYTVDVQDANGCEESLTVIIEQPTQITVSSDLVNVTCANGNDGLITLTVSGGVPNYTYNWDGIAINDSILTELTAGTYDVTISDANGCEIETSLTITQPAELIVSVTGTNITCFGANNGSITSTTTGGTGQINYLWEGPASYTSSNQNIINLAPGNYSITVADVNGCAAETQATITEPTDVVITETITNPSCLNSDGEISVIVSGGTPNYTYAWSNASNQSLINNLPAGTYDLTVTDNNSCQKTAQYILNQASVLATLSGKVLYSGGELNSGDARVLLFRKKDNPTGSVLYDTAAVTIITNEGFIFADIFPGEYIIRTTLITPTDYPNLYSTYYEEVFKWQDATIIEFDCDNELSFNIVMNELQPIAEGNCAISGYITYDDIGGGSKGIRTSDRAMGEPIEGAEIFIEQEPNQYKIGHDVTDENGYYRVPNIPEGTGYYMIVEIPGIPMVTTYTGITVSAGDTGIVNLNFVVDTTAGGGIFIDTISHSNIPFNNFAYLSVYPNPVSNVIYMEYELTEQSDVEIELISITGASQGILLNRKNNYTGKHKHEISLPQYITNGSYFLRVKMGNNYFIKQIIINK